MTAPVLGLVGFFLFFLYDINSITRRSPLLHLGFAVGTLLLAAATAMEMLSAWRLEAFRGLPDLLLLAAGALAFAALIYCLFFALPFDETYRKENTAARKAYTQSAYALCRHPGVLCFWGMYLLWGLAALPSAFWRTGLLFSLLNTLYALFQDRVTFPKLFSNYASYRTQTPFLLPTAQSVRHAIRTWGAFADEEVGM